MRYLLLSLLAVLCRTLAIGQDNASLLFGRVSVNDFRVVSPVVDPSLGAVVLADVGQAEVQGFQYGWRVEFTRTRRLLILNRKGFSAAKITISFSSYLNGMHLLNTLRANTYNLEDGKIDTASLEIPDMFLDTLNGGNMIERFSFPNVREGSIVEYTYSDYSDDMYSLHPWNFQSEYPQIRSEYTVRFPTTFNYVVSRQGMFPIERTNDSAKKTTEMGRYSFRTPVYSVHWKMDNMPAVQAEPFISTMETYVSGLRFQLSEYRIPGSKILFKVYQNWKILNDRLFKDPAFGGVMTTATHFLRKELRAIVADSASDMDRARGLFYYVRDHFVSSGQGLFADDDRTLKEIFKARRGTEAEIDLMLTAMLRDEGLTADAVILSTKDNGLINPYYPITENFNYVIVRLRLNSKDYFLDASDPELGFGKLPLECYNGYSRVVSEQPDSVLLRPDSLVESKFTTLFLSQNDAGDGMTGTYRGTLGYYASEGVRDSVAALGKDRYFEGIRKSYPFDVQMTDRQIDSLRSYDDPVTVHYTLSFPTGGEDRIYFAPMLSEAMKENPFSAATRHFPVEMPYTVNELYVLQMELPKGYVVEELPKPVKVKLNDSDGSYDYGFVVDQNSLQFRSRLILKRAFFLPEEYQTLRDFFALVVKKEGEMIVFKKK